MPIYPLCKRRNDVYSISTTQQHIANANCDESETKMAHVTDIRAPRSVLLDRVAAMLKSLAERHARHGIYRETVTELSALSDRELADIGLNRAQIRSVAKEHAYGPRA